MEALIKEKEHIRVDSLIDIHASDYDEEANSDQEIYETENSPRYEGANSKPFLKRKTTKVEAHNLNFLKKVPKKIDCWNEKKNSPPLTIRTSMGFHGQFLNPMSIPTSARSLQKVLSKDSGITEMNEKLEETPAIKKSEIKSFGNKLLKKPTIKEIETSAAVPMRKKESDSMNDDPKSTRAKTTAGRAEQKPNSLKAPSVTIPRHSESPKTLRVSGMGQSKKKDLKSEHGSSNSIEINVSKYLKTENSEVRKPISKSFVSQSFIMPNGARESMLDNTASITDLLRIEENDNPYAYKINGLLRAAQDVVAKMPPPPKKTRIPRMKASITTKNQRKDIEAKFQKILDDMKKEFTQYCDEAFN